MSKFSYFLQKFNDFSSKIDENSIDSNDFLLIQRIENEVYSAYYDKFINYSEFKSIRDIWYILRNKSKNILQNKGILH